MTNAGIYLITNTKNNKKYVGSSANIARREYDHTRQLNKQAHSNAHLQNSWNKHGEKSFEFYTLVLCAREKKSLLALEQFYINLLRPEYNLLPTAGSRLGAIHTKGTRAKMSAARMGNKNVLGYKQTDEHKENISAGMMGKKKSAEHRANISKTQRARWARNRE